MHASNFWTFIRYFLPFIIYSPPTQRRVYAEKEKNRAREKTLWKSEFMKGKTQAVLDAARRALHLVNHDSRVGLGAAASIKRFGLERLVNIKSICFHTTLKTLATSCVTMRINTSFANKDEMQSIPNYGCLNRELVPKLANHIAHFMFHDKKNQGKRTESLYKQNYEPLKEKKSIIFQQKSFGGSAMALLIKRSFICRLTTKHYKWQWSKTEFVTTVLFSPVIFIAWLLYLETCNSVLHKLL